jgi:hypothetical protein
MILNHANIITAKEVKDLVLKERYLGYGDWFVWLLILLLLMLPIITIAYFILAVIAACLVDSIRTLDLHKGNESSG